MAVGAAAAVAVAAGASAGRAAAVGCCGVTPPQLHPDVEPVRFLLGTWEGEGRGEYPTIAPFEYREAVTFGHVGKPFLAYAQRTTRDGAPAHAEVGYLRSVGGGRVELVLAHPTGLAEVEEGSIVGTRIELRSTGIVRSGTAKDVAALERSFAVEGDTLSYAVRMAAVGLPLQHHLSATLRKVAE